MTLAWAKMPKFITLVLLFFWKACQMPQLNPEFFVPQLIWLALSFIVFYFLMSRKIVPLIGKVIGEREDRINSDLKKAETLKKDLSEAIASYEQAIAEARSKAHNIVQENQKKLSAEVEAEQKAVEEQIAQKTKDSEKRIEAARDVALAQINDIASGATEEILQSLTGAKPTEKSISEALSSVS